MDGYCERLDASFWAEPVNAITNTAFLLAAGLIAGRLRAAPGQWRHRPPVDLVLLAAVLAAIGIGSFLFHTLATRAAALADTLPIALFMLSYVVVFAHRFGGVCWRLAWLAAPVFAGFAAAVGLVRTPVPGLYLPALLGLVLLTGFLATRPDPARRAYWKPFAAASALFAGSLTLRQLDGPLCSSWPLGTHFGWHLCNAVVLYLLLRAAVRRAEETQASTAAAR